MVLLDCLLLAAAPGAVPGGAAAVSEGLRVGSVADFVAKGGPVMIPIGACSLVALAIVVERLVALRRPRVIPPGFLPGLRNVLRDPRTDRGAAVGYCERDGSPVASVFAVGIKRLGEPVDLLERHIAEAGERQVFKLRTRLRLLAVIASIAPLLGLLGTIFGMISAFQTVAVSAEALGKTELLAKGIYEAMITTAAGLIVAIPTLLFYHWLSAVIERRVAEIDAMAAELVEEYALSPAGERAGAAPERVRTGGVGAPEPAAA